jgi:hypothetical protein
VTAGQPPQPWQNPSSPSQLSYYLLRLQPSPYPRSGYVNSFLGPHLLQRVLGLLLRYPPLLPLLVVGILGQSRLGWLE